MSDLSKVKSFTGSSLKKQYKLINTYKNCFSSNEKNSVHNNPVKLGNGYEDQYQSHLKTR